jgi:hypothetical protein
VSSREDRLEYQRILKMTLLHGSEIGEDTFESSFPERTPAQLRLRKPNPAQMPVREIETFDTQATTVEVFKNGIAGSQELNQLVGTAGANKHTNSVGAGINLHNQ